MKSSSRLWVVVDYALIACGWLLLAGGVITRVYEYALMGVVAIVFAYADRPVRFSMRRLLVFLTIAAVMLGTAVAIRDCCFMQRFERGP
jgi:hypothetical protein